MFQVAEMTHISRYILGTQPVRNRNSAASWLPRGPTRKATFRQATSHPEDHGDETHVRQDQAEKPHVCTGSSEVTIKIR